MRKLLLFVGGAAVLGVAYWLISPLWRVQTLDEELPPVQDRMESMSDQERARMDAETDAMRDEVMERSDPMPTVTTLAEGELMPRAHEVAGSAKLISAGGDLFLRFEDLETVNGPDLRIYLSSDLGVDDAVDLGAIRATRGNVNYEVPADTDTSRYRYALIWCRAFRVLFSYAVLQ